MSGTSISRGRVVAIAGGALVLLAGTRALGEFGWLGWMLGLVALAIGVGLSLNALPRRTLAR